MELELTELLGVWLQPSCVWRLGLLNLAGECQTAQGLTTQDTMQHILQSLLPSNQELAKKN